MKKLSFFAASAIMMLASCTSSEVDVTLEDVQNEQPVAVAFDTYLGKTGTTRAGEPGEIVAPDATSGEHKLGSAGYYFGVFAYNTGASKWGTAGSGTTPNFMYNQEVKYSSNAWTYTPIKYWPNGKDTGNTSDPYKSATEANTQHVSFFAYAPYVPLPISGETTSGIMEINETTKLTDTNSGNQKTGDPTIKYKLASKFDAASNVDLLWGTANQSTYNEADGDDPSDLKYNIDLTKQAAEEKVDFNFKHALAKIYEIKTVLDIDANNNTTELYDGTSCVTIQRVTITNDANELCDDGVFDLATGTWTTATPNATAGAITSEINTSTTNCNTAVIRGANAATYASNEWTPSGVTNTAQSLYTEGYAPAFFLIPSDNQKLKITVEYEVATYDKNVKDNYVRTTQTITNKVSLGTIAPNKKYTLTLHIGLTSIKFSATVAGWDEGANAYTVWLPSNVVS